MRAARRARNLLDAYMKAVPEGAGTAATPPPGIVTVNNDRSTDNNWRAAVYVAEESISSKARSRHNRRRGYAGKLPLLIMVKHTNCSGSKKALRRLFIVASVRRRTGRQTFR